MHWTEPATADDSHAALEETLWDAANQLWSNAALEPSEYPPTVLGLIPDCGDMSPLSRRDMSRAKSAVVPAHSAKPTTSSFSHLLSLPEGANVDQAVNETMRAIPAPIPIRNLSRHSATTPELADVLPKSYHILESRTLASLLKTMASISIVDPVRNLPRHSETKPGGRILDPACGSGGMFIQSARFVEAHQKNPTAEISVQGDPIRSHGGAKHSLLTS